MILGSGFSFHNLRVFFSSGADAIDPGNEAFQNWIVQTCNSATLTTDQREAALIDWESAPSARYCHPREEHLLPMHVCGRSRWTGTHRIRRSHPRQTGHRAPVAMKTHVAVLALCLCALSLPTSGETKGWPVLTRYDQDHLVSIALPLGGIGTGTVSLGGRGELRDWQIMNRPAIGFSTVVKGNNAPFFAMMRNLRVEQRRPRL